MSTSDSEFSQSIKPRHDEAETFSRSPPAENPAADTFNIVVSVPESIQIKMVDASALADYEVWIFIASILSNAVVGFGVAYSQALDAKSPSTRLDVYSFSGALFSRNWNSYLQTNLAQEEGARYPVLSH